MSEPPCLASEKRLLEEAGLPGMVNIPVTSPRRVMSGPGFTVEAEQTNGDDVAHAHEEFSEPLKRRGSKRGSISKQVLGLAAGIERTASKLGLTAPPKRQGSLSGHGGLGGAIGLLAMNKIRSNNKAKQARTVLQGLPVWLSKEVLARTTKRVKACKPSEQAGVLRVQNSVMQAEQPIWQKLVEIAMEDKECDIAKEEVLQILRKMQGELEAREACHPDTAFFVPGPVGDTLLHASFLLGMVELGKQLVQETYNTPELVSLPYTNDLKVWFDAKVVSPELDDGGLYTGQTVLHIAIVRKDRKLVQFLLGYGANIVARATGAFFKPKRMVTVVENPTRYQRTVAWIRGTDLSREPLVEVRDVTDSGCYYGEFPLSFAVSIGSVELCKVLFNEYQARKQSKDPYLRELYTNMTSRKSAEAELLSKFREVPATHPSHLDSVDAARLKAKRGSAISVHSAHSEPEPLVASHEAPTPAHHDTPVHRTPQGHLLPPPTPESPPRLGSRRSLKVQPAPIDVTSPESAARRQKFLEAEDVGSKAMLSPTESCPTPETHLLFGVPPSPNLEPITTIHHRRGSYVHTVHPVYSSILPFDLFINVQDSFGNTALHMAVLHRRCATMRWLIKNGGERSMSILNDESYTPLTLAARLGYLEELEVLLSHSRVIAWTFGDVQMVRTPLEQVDTFRMRGSHLHERPNWRSVIEVVVAHEVEAMCDHPLFDTLIKDKWTKFARRKHLVKSIIPFFFGVLTTSLYLYARCFHRFHQLRAWLETGLFKPGTTPLFEVMAGASGSDGGLFARMSAVLSLTCLLVIVAPSILQGWKLRRLKQQDLDPNGDGDTSIYEFMLFVYKNLPFMLTWGLASSLFIGIVAALSGNSRVELQAISVSAVLHWSMLLLHMSSFQSIGVLVIIIFKMLIGDIFKFLVVYVILVMAFSQALFALTQMSDLPKTMETLDHHPGRAFFALVWVSLGGRPLGMDKWNLIKQTDNPALTLVVYIVYVILCTLLMLNLLIAMMQKTFRADMRDTYKTWIFPFAQLVLRYESELQGQERLSCRSGFPAGLHAVHDVESEQYYETAVVPSEKSKREQQYGQERVRMEVVMQVLTEYLDVGLSSLKHALKTLAEEVAAMQGRRAPVVAAQCGGEVTPAQPEEWLQSELFEDDATPVESPLPSPDKVSAEGGWKTHEVEQRSDAGEATQPAAAHDATGSAAAAQADTASAAAPADSRDDLIVDKDKPRRQLTLKRLPGVTPVPPVPLDRLATAPKMGEVGGDEAGKASPKAPIRALSLKKLPSQGKMAAETPAAAANAALPSPKRTSSLRKLPAQMPAQQQGTLPTMDEMLEGPTMVEARATVCDPNGNREIQVPVSAPQVPSDASVRDGITTPYNSLITQQAPDRGDS